MIFTTRVSTVRISFRIRYVRDGRTKASFIAPFPTEEGHNKLYGAVLVSLLSCGYNW